MKKYFIVICYVFCLDIGLINAQFTVIHNFNDTNGANPDGTLTISHSGNLFYGMTSNGGANGDGCIFSIDTTGSGYKDLFDFNGINGATPNGLLTLSITGDTLFGMTEYGGANGAGCVFSIDSNGSGYFKIVDFNGTGYPQGLQPIGSLTLSSSGKVLYGMTYMGGGYSLGNVFSVTTNGSSYTDLMDFNGTTGWTPRGSLTLSGNVLFGMTQAGGAYRFGNIFSIDTNGSGFTDLFNFSGGNQYPFGSLLLSGGVLYGMTLEGTNGNGNIFSINANGSGYSDLLEFNGTDGSGPHGDLTLSGGVLFGMTQSGGAYGDGLVFSIHTDGSAYIDLFDFDGTNGANPTGNVTFIGNTLYGMAYKGGADSDGVIFSTGDTSVTTSDNQLSVVSNQLSVFPNPSTGVFTVAFRHAELACPELVSRVSASQTITIYNVLDELVFSSSTINNSPLTIDLRGNPDGIYLIRIQSKDGKVVTQKKIIKMQ